jgi:mono/diheme cytochrome c family protein
MRGARLAARIGRVLAIFLGVLAVAIFGIVGYEYAAGWRRMPEEERLLDRGRKLYGTYCVPCHGANMQGHVAGAISDAPPLQKPGFAVFFYLMPKDMEGFIAGLVGSGRSQMPGFGQALTAGDLASLAAYIRRANVGPPLALGGKPGPAGAADSKK